MDAVSDQIVASQIGDHAATQRGVFVAWPAVEGWDSLLRAGLLRQAGLLPRTRDGRSMIAVIGNSRDRADASALGCGEVLLIDGCGGRRREVATRVRSAAAWLDEPLVIGDAMMVLAMASIECESELKQIDRAAMRMAISRLESEEHTAAQRSLQRAQLELAGDELCLLLLTSRPGAGDARMFTGLVGVMELDDHITVGITSDRAGRAQRCSRFSAAFRRWDVLQRGEPPASLLEAADVVVIDRGEQRAGLGEGLDTGGQIAALRAMVTGKPVIMVAHEDTSGWLDGASDAGAELISKDATLPELARVIVPLMRSDRLRAQMGVWCAMRGAELAREGAWLDGW